MRPRGIALLLVVGVLGILGVLATTFVTLARLERRASFQRVQATKALLLARSGLEDALARLSAGQDAQGVGTGYLGEDFNGDGLINAGPEALAQVYRVTAVGTPADTLACPLRHALRPSFWKGLGGNPRLVGVDGRERGYTGDLWEGREAEVYALKVEDLNARIHINGGALDAGDRDPDGAGPLVANGTPDYRDASGEGPNGFLRRLLDNLELVIAGANGSPSFGDRLISARPLGGYEKVEDLRLVLGQAAYDLARMHLTVHAWVDPKVVKPQPVDNRPKRWLDIDDTHKSGTWAAALAGKTTVPTATLGNGQPGNPWSQDIHTTNTCENRDYPVTWERGSLYAHKQLRLGPVAMEPRAPVSVNTASREVLASVFARLRGVHLEVWEGTAGFDGGFGFYGLGQAWYPYPNPAAEEMTPWHRTRQDYGMPYTTTLPRQWYGPTNPNGASLFINGSGESLVANGALGRLRETLPITRGQALALADQVRLRISQVGPFRTWAEFSAFVDALPLKEDVNGDGVLDGPVYSVADPWNNPYERRRYDREDLDSDGGAAENQRFSLAADWTALPIAWPTAGATALGLTFVQKDLVKAMANPNTDLNDFNPDENLFKETDKADIGGTGSLFSGGVYSTDPSPYAHTTELCLDPAGVIRVTSLGRSLAGDGRLLAARSLAVTARLYEVHRDTTQADFMGGYLAGAPLGASFQPSVPASPIPLSGFQPLVSYPEPQTLPGGLRRADAGYDGQLGLGQHAAAAGPDERIRGNLFMNLNAAATGDASVADVRGPFHEALVAGGALTNVGNVFPDGVYSEKDAALKLPLAGNFDDIGDLLSGNPNTFVFYVSAWVKPNWFPEASPKAHALISLSASFAHWPPPYPVNSWDFPRNRAPVDLIPTNPAGCYFVPARNNYARDPQGAGAYVHSQQSTRGQGWQSRSLLWGSNHAFYASDNLHCGGILRLAPGGWLPADPVPPARIRPIGKLQAHRWVHLGCVARNHAQSLADVGSTIVLGNRFASQNGGGGWDIPWGLNRDPLTLNHAEPGGGTTPNHLRFGEVAAENNMNYTADATFANVRQGGLLLSKAASPPVYQSYESALAGTGSPGILGRYLKENGAKYVSSPLPAGMAPLRATWTEIPCDLWFDGLAPSVPDGWLGDDLPGTADDYKPLNDRFGPGGTAGPDGKRDVRIDLELWETDGLGYDVRRVTFRDPAGTNPLPIPASGNRLYYRAVFVNDWDAATRANHPLDVTPFLDDVTVTYVPPGGPVVLAWETDPTD